MGVVKANDVIDYFYSPDLSHLNEDEQHVWGYHLEWTESCCLSYTACVAKLGVMEVTIFYDQILYHPPAEEVYLNTSPTLFHVLCMSSKHNEQETQTPHTHTVPLGVCSSSS